MYVTAMLDANEHKTRESFNRSCLETINRMPNLKAYLRKNLQPLLRDDDIEQIDFLSLNTRVLLDQQFDLDLAKDDPIGNFASNLAW